MRTVREPRSKGRILALVGALMTVGVAVVGLTPDAGAAGGPYDVVVANGGFESPTMNAGTWTLRPAGASWTFSDTAGISRANSGYTSSAPAFPEPQQVAYIQRAGKIVQRVWVEPGDVVVFSATQRVNLNTQLQTLSVAIDGVVRGSVTPPRNSWNEYTVDLGITAPGRVNVEIRGLATNSDVTAFVDAVRIVRTPVDIPDQGLAAITQRGILDTRTQPMAAGVLGVLKTGDSEPSVDTPVQAFAEWTNPNTGQAIMFVGGKFSSVQRGAGAPLQNQRYLAAFDRNTGAWIDTFRPTLDGTVWDLDVTADGRLIVGGQFTNINGVASTAGLAALDPATGQVVAGWRAGLAISNSTIRAFARTVKVVGPHVYVGGNFNRVTGPDGVQRTAARIDKLAASTGIPVNGWNGNVGGQVYDLDVTSDRVYAAGKFSTVNGATRHSLAVLTTANGSSVPGLNQMQFTTESSSGWYQQAVVAFEDVVWVGGSQHSTQAYTTNDLTRQRVFTTNPWGDIQTLAAHNGYLYGGSHANPSTFMYTDATHFTNLTGWTTKDPAKWIGAIDMENNTFVPTWVPQVGVSNGEGGWELVVDSTGCMWAGGDFDRGSSTLNGYHYAQGFTKFCTVDNVAPTTPATSTAVETPGGISLTWSISTDDRTGGVRYEVLRNDRPIATGLVARSFVDPTGTSTDRYFIRAVDAAGNRSATTPVVIAGVDTVKPTSPRDLVGVPGADGEAVLSWSASTDNFGVTGYNVYRSGAFVTSVAGTNATLTGLPVGSNSFQVSALDAAGNESSRSASASVIVTGLDLVKPRVPQDLAGSPGGVGEAVLTWTASTDNVGVTGYRVYRSGVQVAEVASTTATISGLPAGSNSFQVSAFDAAGNESGRTASVSVVVNAPDVTRPSSPPGLVGVPGADGEAVLTWSASTDNVGVTAYNVYRSGSFVTTVSGLTATITGLATGPNNFQVSALDAAGNESLRSVSVAVQVTGPDITNPTTPRDLAAVVEANGDVVLTWTASNDNVGVAGYTIFQTGVAVTTVAGPTATITGLAPGTYSFQVQAYDAAGNTSFKTASVSAVVPPL
jgi:hypothetical protein